MYQQPSLYTIVRILSVLSFRKATNVLKVYLSYYVSRWTKSHHISHFPFTISFEPTTQCNLGCPECPSGLKSFSRETGNANLKLLQDLITQTKDHLIFLYLYFQGEPLIHKNFCDMVRIAKQNKIYTVTSTNGHYLTPSKCEEIIQSGLDKIIISIDGSTQDVYERYRIGGQLMKVIEGTKNLVKAKKIRKVRHPEIVFQMIIFRTNEHQVDQVKMIAYEIGVDQFLLKTAQIYDFKEGNPLIPQNPKFSRYHRSEDGTWQIKNRLRNQCWKMWHSAVCTWDGRILPCCFDKDAQYEMGKMEEGFSTIWKNERYAGFRRKLLESRSAIDICTNCSEGTKVWETI